MQDPGVGSGPTAAAPGASPTAAVGAVCWGGRGRRRGVRLREGSSRLHCGSETAITVQVNRTDGAVATKATSGVTGAPAAFPTLLVTAVLFALGEAALGRERCCAAAPLTDWFDEPFSLSPHVFLNCWNIRLSMFVWLLTSAAKKMFTEVSGTSFFKHFCSSALVIQLLSAVF